MSEETNHPLLDVFKKRMRIFHDAEDDNLNVILTNSESAIKRVTGRTDTSDPSLSELVIERSRYVYNDQVEFFYENFKNEILGVSFEKYDGKED